MKTIEIQIFKFEELSEEAQQNAISKNQSINVDFDWWVHIYEDAKNIGLKITGFDLDRNRHCTGKLIESFGEVCIKIISEHGKECQTHKTAQEYLSKFNDLVSKHSNGIKTDEVEEGKEWDFDNECKDIEEEFLNDILEDYYIMLQNECEYLTSEESIKETLISNEYDFTESGKIY
jgi:hypothetical protein